MSLPAVLLAAAVAGLAGCAGTTTVTQTLSVPTQAGAPPAAQARASTYSGNGTKEIGTVTVSAPSEIRWTCSGCAFFSLTSMASGPDVIAISSTRGSGTSAVDPGTYQAVRVLSNGDWTIRILAGR